MDRSHFYILTKKEQKNIYESKLYTSKEIIHEKKSLKKLKAPSHQNKITRT